MNLTALLDVAIGLTLVYLGASLFVTILNEYIAQLFNWRGRHLIKSLESLFTDPATVTALKQNAAFKPFFEGRPGDAPSFVDTKVLGNLLVGGLAAAQQAGTAVERFKVSVAAMADSALKKQLEALIQTAGGSTESLVAAVSDWTDRSLTALGEGYKRHLQKVSLLVGLVSAMALNLNTIAIVARLYRDKEARDAAVAVAIEISANDSAFAHCMTLPAATQDSTPMCARNLGLVRAVQSRNATLGKLPIGWDPVPDSFGAWASALWSGLLGFALTALALSLGAPFWFDLLNRFVNIRHSMRKPDEK